MTDLVTRIAEQVRYQYMPAETRAVLDEAASLLRSQAEEIARLREAVLWALGEGPNDQGEHFDPPETGPRYWWRTTLRRMARLAPAAINRSGEP